MLSVGSYENVDEYSGKVQFNWKHDKIIKIIIINIINKRFVFYCAVRKTGRSFFTGLFKDSERERWKCYRFYNIYFFFFFVGLFYIRGLLFTHTRLPSSKIFSLWAVLKTGRFFDFLDSFLQRELYEKKILKLLRVKFFVFYFSTKAWLIRLENGDNRN